MAQTSTQSTHESHPEPNYFAVILVLTVLTAIEIGLTYAPLSKLAIGILLVGLALTKAIIVAMFFMHLKFEKATLALIAATPLILIAIMTFVLITSSGTMAMAVNFGYRRDRKKTAILMLLTALLGATFVGMQAFEWTKLIMEGVRPWENPWGAAQFGSSFFMITGFHGTHVTIGVIFLIAIARKVWRGDFDVERRGFFTSRKGYYEIVEITGLYWHFVDLVWVFIFAFFYLW